VTRGARSDSGVPDSGVSRRQPSRTREDLKTTVRYIYLNNNNVFSPGPLRVPIRQSFDGGGILINSPEKRPPSAGGFEL